MVRLVASTDTVVSSPWIRAPASAWVWIIVTSGAKAALQAPTQSPRVDTSRWMSSRA
jgi:hypothetical protein